MNGNTRNSSLVRLWIRILLLGTIVLILSSKGITDESVVSLQGDMAKYLMNGVYFYDLIREHPITNPFEHACRYFARYPALSLGHHPLLVSVAEVPFYTIFGVSVFSARLSIIFFMLLAAVMWFLLIETIYNDVVAFFSSLLFITTPFIVSYSRLVMSEIPTLSLIIVTAFLFYQYCEYDKKRFVFLSALTFILSVYAKHIAVFMLPVLLGCLLAKKGWKRLFAKELLVSYAIIAILIVPLAAITLKFSQVNVSVIHAPVSSKLVLSNVLYHIKAVWTHHLLFPVLGLSLLSMLISIYRRDRRIILFLLWIVCCYLLITYLGVKRPRDSMYWIPVFSLFAATTILFFQSRLWKIVTSTIIILIAGYQFVVAYSTEPEYAEGYEEAAKYVVENKKGESILYSSVKDTGYFIFFIRKHSPEQDFIVLRADKILATSRMRKIVEERISTRKEIYQILKDYGTRYVVIEDIASKSRSLEWLREEMKSEKFILRKAVTLRSNKSTFNNIPIVIYEFKDYRPPKEGAIVDMNIPLMGETIAIPLKELLHENR